jgi:endonuclease III related protein
MRSRLPAIFDTLLSAFGPRYWWPGDSPLEVAVGAILTQNTAWRNVEKAIRNMKEEALLDAGRLRKIDREELAAIIRPAGFYRLKAARLKSFVDFLWVEYGGQLEPMKEIPTERLRSQLLSVSGIGPETADSILLYAVDKPVFVVDAYTLRFLRNHGLHGGSPTYDVAQKLFMDNLVPDAHLFNEFHALIVALGQQHCKKVAACGGCPLEADKGRGRK